VAKIIFSKIAKSDLKEIINYIKRDSVKYAYLERDKIVTAIDSLLKQPLIGRILPDLMMIVLESLFLEIIGLFIRHHRKIISSYSPSITTPAWLATTPLLRKMNNRYLYRR
jgi:plasmid stabilization system protein ParE